MTSSHSPGLAQLPLDPEPKKPKRRKHRDWSGATFGLLLGTFGMFGARLGQLWIGFDIFAQFWVQFGFIALASALGLFSPRYKTLVAVVFCVVFVAGYSVWPHYVSSGPASPVAAARDGEVVLRVASFNTFAENNNLDAIANEILRLDADVVTLVEFSATKAAVLGKVRKVYPYQQQCVNVAIACETAIISKSPLTYVSDLDYWEGPPYLMAQMGPEFGNVAIVAAHTSRFPHQRAQLKQVLALVKLLELQPSRIILMGDFNATPFSRITQVIADNLGLTRLTFLPTWPATFGLPQIAIDHIFVSPSIRALDHERIGEFAGSDHYPITITLAVPKQ
ncbi:MAG: endonuclease/exonuclease/phosphatase family protein [Alphaproteobacteria bacterium]|nr:endonuclease/exonuclease/phosphatase family protein [Alphaproteobacteria bacterium]